MPWLKDNFSRGKEVRLSYFWGNMHTYAQSSQFSVAYSDALHLLRFAPCRVAIQGQRAVLHYHVPHGIWQGAPVYYSLVRGLHVIRWQGTVLNPSGRGFFVRASATPLGSFQATHLLEGVAGATVVRDELSCDNPEFAKIFESLQIVYQFAQRRDMAALQAEAPTRELPRLDSGCAAG